MKYWLHPDAALEHVKQISYYEDQRRGLGNRYHVAMRDAARRACDAPTRYKVERPPDIRKIALRGFKFNIIFRQVEDEIQILAVAHYRRRPGYWAGRV